MLSLFAFNPLYTSFQAGTREKKRKIVQYKLAAAHLHYLSPLQIRCNRTILGHE
jgi:hypothetical protein